jgi:hypothetical protein
MITPTMILTWIAFGVASWAVLIGASYAVIEAVS